MSNAESGDGIPVIPEAVRQGLSYILCCAILSVLTTFSLLIGLAYKHIKDYRESNRNSSSSWSAPRRTRSPQGYIWLVNIFIGDFILSSQILVFSIRALSTGSVEAGPFCTIQGILLEIGELAGAMWVFVVTVHTFLLIAGGHKCRAWLDRKSTSGKGRWCVVIAIWAWVLFNGVYGIVFIEPLHPELGPFYDPSAAGWCWVGDSYFWERIWGFYAYVFLNIFALTVVYTFLFFYIRIQAKKFGNNASALGTHSSLEAGDPTQTEDSPTLTVLVTMESATHAQTNVGNDAFRRINRVSAAFLLYPAIYVILVLPVAVARISEFADSNFSLKAVYVASCLFSLQGFAQVVLYTTTRKGIISWDRIFRKCKRSASTKPGSLESYHSASYYLPAPSKALLSSRNAISMANLPPDSARKSSPRGRISN